MARSKKKDNLDFEAITEDNFQKIESAIKSYDITRRVAITILMRSRAELVEVFKDNPDIFFELWEDIKGYLEKLKDMKEMAETAQARLLSVGLALSGHASFEELQAGHRGKP